MGYTVHVIKDGYSKEADQGQRANCSCTLIKGKYNIIVDTMTAWDKPTILEGLMMHSLSCDDINFVICTHGHSDHIGNNNLFLNAKHIVGYGVSFQDIYYDHAFGDGEEYIIDEHIKVIPTPGHTHTDVTVLVQTENQGLVAVAGDLFEREEDLNNSDIWMDAGSEDPDAQTSNREKVLAIADWIVPGHGPMFKVFR